MVHKEETQELLRRTVEQRVLVSQSAAEVYRRWSDPAAMASLFSHLEHTSARGQGQAHWLVRLPSGARLGWRVETHLTLPNAVVAWCSVPGEPVTMAGTVRIAEVGRLGTQVVVRVEYLLDGPQGHELEELLTSTPLLRPEAPATVPTPALPVGLPPSLWANAQ